MITAQILPRQIGALTVRQNHKTQYFNLTDMAKGYPGKFVADWLKREETKTLIAYLQVHEGIEIPVKTARGGPDKGTWAHPLVAIDFGMWLNVEFKVAILKWAMDNLCLVRDRAGDSFKAMTAAIQEVLQPKHGITYAQEAAMVQELAGIPIGKRNEASEDKLRRLDKLEAVNARLLRRGILSREDRRRRIQDALELWE